MNGLRPDRVVAHVLLALLAALAVGCPQQIYPEGTEDAGAASTPEDGAIGTDGGGLDPSVVPDAGASQVTDSGSSDAGSVDAGQPDSSPSDAGSADAGGAGACQTSYLTPVRVPVPSGANAFSAIRALAFDSARNLYVLNAPDAAGTASVSILSPAPQHQFIRSFGLGVIGFGRDLVVDGAGSVFVLSYRGTTDTPRVDQFDGSGTRVGGFVANGGGQSAGFAMTRDPAGQLYISDGAVHVYTPDGVFQKTVGKVGVLPGRIGVAMALAWESSGKLWLADMARHNLQLWNPGTDAQDIEFGEKGPGPGQFDDGAPDEVIYGPSRLALDGAGNLYVNDPYASRLQKLSAVGDFLGQVTFGSSREVGPIAVEPSSGHVYVGRRTQIDILCPL